MITVEQSIPTKSDSFLKGIDIFYTQFNEVNFYIEDEDQENFYHVILQKLFPDIMLSKIFPLRGKKNVIDKSKRHIGDNKKVFIVDKDFDDLLGKKIIQSNLFYLNEYSIENYLIDKNAFHEYVIEEKPRIKRKEIPKLLKFENTIIECCKTFCELTILHLLVQHKNLGIQNTALPPEKFIQLNNVIRIKQVELDNYKVEIETRLKSLDKRMTLKAQIKKIRKLFNIGSSKDILAHIPGKYLVKYFKCIIEHLFSLASRNIDSFNFRLARSNNFIKLNYLTKRISEYIK
ncbi:MAG: DUF4435 domain-containing protein [Saprospiraceae bacterium]|nr:DUF4435 domain-containing protein [Saprospiraceae bacterium]